MGVREELQKRIDRKRQEIADLSAQIAAALSYIQALEEAMRLMPRDGINQPDAMPTLRPNSGVARAHDVIKSAGKPLHINEMLSAMGREITREARGAITSSLAAYVRRGEIFTRVGPNTYGLIEFGRQNGHAPANDALPDLPAEFGKT